MKRTSQLEVFPDELFLDLFSYISPQDLYRCWRHLNSRLTAIIRSVRISFELNEDLQINQEIFDYFAAQINHLHLRIPCQTLEFRQFPFLKSLVLDTKLTRTQMNSIQSIILPQLQRLTLTETWKHQSLFNKKLFDEIYSKQWIKVLHLPSLPDYFLEHSNQFAFIQTMIFNRMTLTDVHRILSLQKLLKRLKVTIVTSSTEDKFSQISINNTTYQHEHLIDFHTIMNTFNRIDDLYGLLSRLSRLKYLHVECDSLNYQDFKRLAVELNTRIPKLKIFNCTFKQTRVENINDIHCLSPLFRRIKQKKIEWTGGWHYYCITTQDI